MTTHEQELLKQLNVVILDNLGAYNNEAHYPHFDPDKMDDRLVYHKKSSTPFTRIAY